MRVIINDPLDSILLKEYCEFFAKKYSSTTARPLTRVFPFYDMGVKYYILVKVGRTPKQDKVIATLRGSYAESSGGGVSSGFFTISGKETGAVAGGYTTTSNMAGGGVSDGTTKILGLAFLSGGGGFGSGKTIIKGLTTISKGGGVSKGKTIRTVVFLLKASGGIASGVTSSVYEALIKSIGGGLAKGKTLIAGIKKALFSIGGGRGSGYITKSTSRSITLTILSPILYGDNITINSTSIIKVEVSTPMDGDIIVLSPSSTYNWTVGKHLLEARLWNNSTLVDSDQKEVTVNPAPAYFQVLWLTNMNGDAWVYDGVDGKAPTKHAPQVQLKDSRTNLKLTGGSYTFLDGATYQTEAGSHEFMVVNNNPNYVAISPNMFLVILKYTVASWIDTAIEQYTGYFKEIYNNSKYKAYADFAPATIVNGMPYADRGIFSPAIYVMASAYEFTFTIADSEKNLQGTWTYRLTIMPASYYFGAIRFLSQRGDDTMVVNDTGVLSTEISPAHVDMSAIPERTTPAPIMSVVPAGAIVTGYPPTYNLAKDVFEFSVTDVVKTGTVTVSRAAYVVAGITQIPAGSISTPFTVVPAIQQTVTNVYVDFPDTNNIQIGDEAYIKSTISIGGAPVKYTSSNTGIFNLVSGFTDKGKVLKAGSFHITASRPAYTDPVTGIKYLASSSQPDNATASISPTYITKTATVVPILNPTKYEYTGANVNAQFDVYLAKDVIDATPPGIFVEDATPLPADPSMSLVYNTYSTGNPDLDILVVTAHKLVMKYWVTCYVNTALYFGTSEKSVMEITRIQITETHTIVTKEYGATVDGCLNVTRSNTGQGGDWTITVGGITKTATTFASAATAIPDAGSQTVTVKFVPNDEVNFIGFEFSDTLTITKKQITMTIALTTSKGYGRMLSEVIDVSIVPASPIGGGSYLYQWLHNLEVTSIDPTKIFDTGSHNITVTYTPNNWWNYNGVSLPKTIQILQQTPTITWNPPALTVDEYVISDCDTYFAEPSLWEAQNATVTAPYGGLTIDMSFYGTEAYSGNQNVSRAPGSYSVTYTFTPYDALNYKTATATELVTVTPPNLVIHCVSENYEDQGFYYVEYYFKGGFGAGYNAHLDNNNSYGIEFYSGIEMGNSKYEGSILLVIECGSSSCISTDPNASPALQVYDLNTSLPVGTWQDAWVYDVATDFYAYHAAGCGNNSNIWAACWFAPIYVSNNTWAWSTEEEFGGYGYSIQYATSYNPNDGGNVYADQYTSIQDSVSGQYVPLSIFGLGHTPIRQMNLWMCH